jgi:excisionase family DNA binding protein
MAMPTAPADELRERLRSPFYSPGELAVLASVPNAAILNAIREGRIVSVKLSERTYRIPRKAVIRFLGIETPGPLLTERPSRAVDV